MSQKDQRLETNQADQESLSNGSRESRNTTQSDEHRTIMVRVDSHYVCLSPSQFAELCGTK